MLKLLRLIVVVISIAILAFGQQQGAEKKAGQQPQAAPIAGFISPSEVNVQIGADIRTMVVMAAVNVAGLVSETGGQPLSPARAELMKDLAGINPQLKAELSEFYKAHRRSGTDEMVDALRYEALSLVMTPPPSFTIYRSEDLPDDLRSLLTGREGSEPELIKLIRRFYLQSGIKQVLPKYVKVGELYASAYRVPAGEMIYKTLNYFHAQPDTLINMRPLVVTTGDPGSNNRQKQTVVNRTRTRYVFVVPDPLAPIGTTSVRDDILNQKEDLVTRRAGDDYIVLIGPSRTANVDTLREALIRFVIDPILERHLRSSLEYKNQITKLVSAVPTAERPFGSSVYLVLRESLAQASEARMRRIQSNDVGGSYGDDQATFDLAQAYQRGAVLSFHFYESLLGYEKVGINIEEFFDRMLATANFEQEARRPQQFESVVKRVSDLRRIAAARESSGNPDGTAGSADAVTRKVIASDDLIRQRRFGDARPVLDQILAQQPDNARALYGMAQVVNQMPSSAESDPKADENDKIQAQHDRLAQAMKLYRKAIEHASSASEGWLIQWSHVFIARILDFEEFRNDAVAEYEMAIALGDLANGAYKEALEGKRRPYGQK
jgi:hypothetical protein